MEDIHGSGMLLHDLAVHPPGNVLPPPPPREKNKRPQLSCNPCRARKVKCDRIQPCSACSLHQIADICHYDLSEAERQPILQAEALKEKDRTIASLRDELASLRGESVKSEFDDVSGTTQKIRLPPRSPKKTDQQSHQSHFHGESEDQIFVGEHGMIGMADDFDQITLNRRPPSSTRANAQVGDITAFQTTTSHPFPTLWSAKDHTLPLIRLLPSEQDLFFYLDTFQRRSLSFSFPHVPEEVTAPEVRNFMESLEHNAALYPDYLALLFAALAQGLQDGVFDKFGGKWTAGHVESESKKGDVYIAASMQCLRLASFLNRPTLRVVQTMMIMAPYLTNSGKFRDASALFGETVRLAQGLGLHRDPSQLNIPMMPKELVARKILWWWMLHMDQQYSLTLGRPLAISTAGDCPSPELHLPDPVSQSIWNFIVQFSLLGRSILSMPHLANDKIDRYTDDLVKLQDSLPLGLQFDASWLDRDRPLIGWPLDVQAAILHAKAHNFLILLNRRRSETLRRNSENSRINVVYMPADTDCTGVMRGRPRVLESCRALLHAFEFYQTRLRAAMICWTMGQMAFNASMLLTLSMLETGETQDLLPVQHAYSTFLEMNKLGVHKLAGAAVERLGRLMKEFRTEDSANETVMGPGGMMLLEDPGSHKIGPESYSGYTTCSSSPGTPQKTSHLGQPSKGSTQRKRQTRKSTTTRDARVPKSRRSSVSKAPRPLADRRFSDSVTPRPSQRKRATKSNPPLSIFTSLPDEHIFASNSSATVKSETLFTPSLPTFDGLAQSSYSSPHPQQAQDMPQSHDGISRPHSRAYASAQQRPQQQTQQPSFSTQQHQPRRPHQPQPHQQQANHSSHVGLTTHHHQLPPTPQASNGDHQPFDFSDTSAPYSSEFFDANLPSAVVAGHTFDEHNLNFEHPPFSAPPFSMPSDQSFGAVHF